MPGPKKTTRLASSAALPITALIASSALLDHGRLKVTKRAGSDLLYRHLRTGQPGCVVFRRQLADQSRYSVVRTQEVERATTSSSRPCRTSDTGLLHSGQENHCIDASLRGARQVGQYTTIGTSSITSRAPARSVPSQADSQDDSNAFFTTPASAPSFRWIASTSAPPL